MNSAPDQQPKANFLKRKCLVKSSFKRVKSSCTVMAEIVDHFERKQGLRTDQSEAELIREKLERLVSNILTLVEKRDKRFQSTLIKSGSVYEGV